jgi:hypothetical protein
MVLRMSLDQRETVATATRGGPAHVPVIDQLHFLVRVRVASPRQFGLAFDHDVWWAYKRIEQLCRQGLADRDRPLRDLPGVVWATPEGLAAVGLARARPPRLSLDRLAHDLAVTELLLSLRRTPGARVRGERELRRGQGSPPAGVISVHAGPRHARTHCPDLAVEFGGRRWAVEVEFSPKGKQRLRSILSGYRGSEYRGGVVYYVREPDLAATLSRTALDCGLGARLALRPWELWPSPSPSVGEIQGLARRHRELAEERVAPQEPSHRCNPAGASADESERERLAAIEAWERQLERRDGQRGRRPRLGRRGKGA